MQWCLKDGGRIKRGQAHTFLRWSQCSALGNLKIGWVLVWCHRQSCPYCLLWLASHGSDSDRDCIKLPSVHECNLLKKYRWKQKYSGLSVHGQLSWPSMEVKKGQTCVGKSASETGGEGREGEEVSQQCWAWLSQSHRLDSPMCGF